MAKHYQDRFERGEDFSEAPALPVELDTPACGHFKPTAEALADAAAEAEHCRDPYACNG